MNKGPKNIDKVPTGPQASVVAKRERRLGGLVLAITVVVSLAVVLIPVFLIMPFKPQTERALSMSYVLKRWSPTITIVTAITTLALVVWLWRRSPRWWRQALLVIAVLLTLPPVWFARQNHFEWMFNPLRNSSYASAADASFVADGEMVLAVKLNNEAVAYPVGVMAYHHLVQDVVGGTPLCATY